MLAQVYDSRLLIATLFRVANKWKRSRYPPIRCDTIKLQENKNEPQNNLQDAGWQGGADLLGRQRTERASCLWVPDISLEGYARD